MNEAKLVNILESMTSIHVDNSKRILELESKVLKLDMALQAHNMFIGKMITLAENQEYLIKDLQNQISKINVIG